MRCLVLAGGTPQPGEPLYEETLGRPKASLELAGRPMIQWVLDALAASGEVDHIVLVGDLDALDLSFPGTIDRVPAGTTMAESLYSGIDRLLEVDPETRRAVFCWSDIPMATGTMIHQLLNEARTTAPDADVVAGLIARSTLEGRWPDVSELWLRVREGQFVAADIGLFDPTKAAPLRHPLEILTSQRKSALRQAATVGIGTLIRYVLGALTLAGLERTIAKRYGIRAHIMIATDPELGLDVDGPVNLGICRRELES